MNRLRISIALATYHSERHLKQQLESYTTQTRLPDELIVSDDHSTDSTLGIVEEFQNIAPFTVLLASNPRARSAIQWNFENAVRRCTGEIILFSDHDDVWLPHHVEKLADALEADERVLAVSSNSEVVDEDLNRMGYTFAQSERYPRRLCQAVTGLPKNQLELVMRQRILAGHGLAFRRSLIPLILPFSTDALHDFWVYFLAAAAGRVTYVEEPLTLYRSHEKQTMGGERKSLAKIATNLREGSGDEAHTWEALIERFRKFPRMGVHYDYSLELLEEKLEFVNRRTRNRKRSLPTRLLCTSLELLRGRYHRLGRGVITFARDLYGMR
jgi:glycosyltransferase involved in cell wall biosynthesis